MNLIISVDHTAGEVVQFPFPDEEGTADDAEESLQDFIRKLDPCIGRRAVDIRAAKRVAHDHDDGADKDREDHPAHFVLALVIVDEVGNRHGLDAVRRKRYEHRERVEEEISQKRADASDEESTEGIEDQCRCHDDDIIQIEMTARYGKAERGQSYVYSHE